MATKRIGKGTTVHVQPCTDDGGNPPSVTTDLTDTGPWVTLGCHFDVKPPSCSYDTITGDACLEDEDEPSTELGNAQADNPSFTPPFDPGDAEYQLLEDWCSTSECIAVRFTYPDDSRHYFYARIQTMEPDNIERNTFMRTPITLLRTSKFYRTDVAVPTGLNFSCSTCREAT
jgi:hypothetical protein